MGLMYDKVTLWKSGGFKPNIIDLMASKLNRVEVTEEISTGKIIMSGFLKGLRISLYPSGLSVIGSLPKFLYNDNIHPLNRKTTGQAIEAISESLGLDIGDAKVNGLEFGFNFPVSSPVADYLLRLGELKGLQRYKFSASTLYYKPKGKKQRKVLCFYDKIEDARSKGVTIPVGFEEANLLKYELRLNGRLSDQLKYDNITASRLKERSFYKLLVMSYQSYYKGIFKQRQTNSSDMDNIKTVSDACDVLLGRLLNDGEQGKIEAYLEELKRLGVFGNRMYYSRLKKKLTDAASKAGGGLEDELIRELDNDIENLGAYI